MTSTHRFAVSTPVPDEEIRRRIAEYRKQGFERQAMPHGIYQDPFIVCPWPGCGFRIAAVDFQVEQNRDPHLYSRVISAWWQGPGIVGRCPGCRSFVLFSMDRKEQVVDPADGSLTVLPDDWHQQAYIVP
jgi:hypothetical protein